MIWPKLPLVTADVRKRLWSIIAIVSLYLLYMALNDLFARQWGLLGLKSGARSVLTFGFVIILLIALSGLAASQKLATLAIKDGLTGLFNQTYIRARLLEEISRAERYRAPFSLILIDLDDFKAANDAQGHVAGDRILRSFAELLLKNIRISDIAGRFGGDEFLVLLPQTTFLDASTAAERIRLAAAEHFASGEGVRFVTRPLTASFGVCSRPIAGTAPEDILNSADEALAKAKREGGNRVVALVD